jgi:hypothetical protein
MDDDTLEVGLRRLVFKPLCDTCGEPFLKGSPTTCLNCLRRERFPTGRHRQEHLRCECGELAVAVIYVRISVGEVPSDEPLAVCLKCLDLEIETLRDYL